MYSTKKLFKIKRNRSRNTKEKYCYPNCIKFGYSSGSSDSTKEDLQNKPSNKIIEIIEGRVEKSFKKQVLLEQVGCLVKIFINFLTVLSEIQTHY